MEKIELYDGIEEIAIAMTYDPERIRIVGIDLRRNEVRFQKRWIEDWLPMQGILIPWYLKAGEKEAIIRNRFYFEGLD